MVRPTTIVFPCLFQSPPPRPSHPPLRNPIIRGEHCSSGAFSTLVTMIGSSQLHTGITPIQAPSMPNTSSHPFTIHHYSYARSRSPANNERSWEAAVRWHFEAHRRNTLLCVVSVPSLHLMQTVACFPNWVEHCPISIHTSRTYPMWRCHLTQVVVARDTHTRTLLP